MSTYRPKLTSLSVVLSIVALCLLPAGAGAVRPSSQPESVELEFFIGTANYPSHILLEWQSVSEIHTLYFRIYRGRTNDPNQAMLISPDINAHPGTTTGYYYTYQDTLDLIGGTTYYYWIQDEDTNGATTLHLDADLVPVVPWGCSRYDVVCDFVIDTQDFTAIASRWNCSTGNACFVGAYDFNLNGRIDIADIVADTSRWNCQFGQGCYS